jgi:hypothetical protein
VTALAGVLLAALLVGHFLGDFTPLATARMQEAKAAGGPLGPILEHAAIHALITAAIVALIARPDAGVVALAGGIQLATHFVLDAGRGRASRLYPALSDAGRQAFWTALGADQLAHGLVLVWITTLVT